MALSQVEINTIKHEITSATVKLLINKLLRIGTNLLIQFKHSDFAIAEARKLEDEQFQIVNGIISRIEELRERATMEQRVVFDMLISDLEAVRVVPESMVEPFTYNQAANTIKQAEKIIERVQVL